MALQAAAAASVGERPLICSIARHAPVSGAEGSVRSDLSAAQMIPPATPHKALVVLEAFLAGIGVELVEAVALPLGESDIPKSRP